jgi:hypothetical protein
VARNGLAPGNPGEARQALADNKKQRNWGIPGGRYGPPGVLSKGESMSINLSNVTAKSIYIHDVVSCEMTEYKLVAGGWSTHIDIKTKDGCNEVVLFYDEPKEDENV